MENPFATVGTEPVAPMACIFGVFLWNFHTWNLGMILWSIMFISVLSVCLHLSDFWTPMTHPLTNLGNLRKPIFSQILCRMEQSPCWSHAMSWVEGLWIQHKNATMSTQCWHDMPAAGVCGKALLESPQNMSWQTWSNPSPGHLLISDMFPLFTIPWPWPTI